MTAWQRSKSLEGELAEKEGVSGLRGMTGVRRRRRCGEKGGNQRGRDGRAARGSDALLILLHRFKSVCETADCVLVFQAMGVVALLPRAHAWMHYSGLYSHIISLVWKENHNILQWSQQQALMGHLIRWLIMAYLKINKTICITLCWKISDVFEPFWTVKKKKQNPESWNC